MIITNLVTADELGYVQSLANADPDNLLAYSNLMPCAVSRRAPSAGVAIRPLILLILSAGIGSHI